MSSPTDKRTVMRIIKDLSSKQTVKQNILFEIHNQNQAHFIFNRPKRMNAFAFDMYLMLTEFIQKANQMKEIKYIILRGAGGNFSSGNDLNNFFKEQFTKNIDTRSMAQAMANLLKNLGNVFIQSKKPIFALTQGRVIGFAFTKLALCDRVFSAENSVFVAPLVKIAQGPEMASSYLFPKIFGQSLAEQIIVKAKVMKSAQLEKYNFLTNYKNIQQAQQALQAHIAQLQKLDWRSYLQARRLLRQTDKQKIIKANVLQCQNLVQRWCNPELPTLMMKYLSNRQMRPKL